MIDLRSVIADFGEPLVVERRAPGTWIAGIYTESYAVATDVGLASIQPGVDKSVVLPEGVRQEDALTVYSITLLRGAEDPEGYSADRFTYRLRTFEVQSIEDWSAGNQGLYYRAIALRVKAL